MHFFAEKRDYLDRYCPEIFEILAEAKITQVELARAAGWPRGTVSSWLVGVNRIRPDDADKLYDVARELRDRKQSCSEEGGV